MGLNEVRSYPKPTNELPHLVILGAGASLAALPEGDRFGREVPLLLNLPEVLDIDPLLDNYGINLEERNFEDLYSDLYTSGNNKQLLHELEHLVRSYFNDLVIPDSPTIYDYLLLSLRDKDFITTFNWDPLLLQSAIRNFNVTTLPNIAYLHGNVNLGICNKDMIKSPLPGKCSQCGDPLQPSQLLFPVKEKDYASNPFISGEWSGLESTLNSAYIVTIFGYSAPVTDAKAVDIMESAWSDPGKREFEEIEIIDIKSEDELLKTWERFIVRSHYRITNDFFKSLLFRYPRRTCETIWNQFMMLELPIENKPPLNTDLYTLQSWYRELINEENIGDN